MNVSRFFRTALGVAVVISSLAAAAQPIKLGELNSYKVLPGVPRAVQEGHGPRAG